METPCALKIFCVGINSSKSMLISTSLFTSCANRDTSGVYERYQEAYAESDVDIIRGTRIAPVMAMATNTKKVSRAIEAPVCVEIQ